MTKGIAIAILEKYANLLIDNIDNLYNRLGVTIPMELWQVGKEISQDTLHRIQVLNMSIGKIAFKNVEDYTKHPEHFKGWQIKAFMLKYTNFDEVIISDCDVVYGMNPEVIFKDEGYIKTGTYFFRDYQYHYPKNINEIMQRKKFIRRYLPEKKSIFPSEWNYVYENIYDPNKHIWYYQESGCVFFNKKRHTTTVELIYYMNDNWKDTYKFIYGDKETFWLSCVVTNTEFTMNPPYPTNMTVDISRPYIQTCFTLTHMYKGKYFFSQKGYPKVGS